MASAIKVLQPNCDRHVALDIPVLEATITAQFVVAVGRW